MLWRRHDISWRHKPLRTGIRKAERLLQGLRLRSSTPRELQKDMGCGEHSALDISPAA